MKKLVTVYITNYNYANYIEQCIKSVLNQTYQNIEILIFDDGSTDNSKSIIEQYTSEGRIKAYFNENQGLTRTIIEAYAKAKGSYVVRVDADDWLEPSMIENLVKKIETDERIAMVFPDYFEVDENGSIILEVKRYNFENEVSLLDQPAHGACSMMRRDVYEKVGGHNRDFDCQDGVDIWLAIISDYKVANIQKPLFYYRQHGHNLTRNQAKLLRTRHGLYKYHAYKGGYYKKQTVAVIPIRSQLVYGEEFALCKLGGRTLVDMIIDKALYSNEVSTIVVISESERILNHVKNSSNSRTSKKKASNIEVLQRPSELARKGSDVSDTLRYFLNRTDTNYDTIVLLTSEYPFYTANFIDTAIYYQYLFGVDGVDSVMADPSIFYYHSGAGIELWNDIKVKHESDYLLKRVGGITVLSVKSFSDQNTTIMKNMGHILIDRISSFRIQDLLDTEMVDFMSDGVDYKDLTLTKSN